MDLKKKWNVNIPVNKLDTPSIQMLIDFCIREKFYDNRLFILIEENFPDMNADDDFFKQEFVTCGQIQEEIYKLEDVIPDKRTKEYNSWEEKMNFLFENYNKLANFAAYKLFK